MPAAQATHDDAPVDGCCVPSGHMAQVSDAVTLAKWPVEQAVQDDCFRALLNEPVGQGVQADAPGDAWKYPGVHESHVTLRPVTFDAVPCSHGVHTCCCDCV